MDRERVSGYVRLVGPPGGEVRTVYRFGGFSMTISRFMLAAAAAIVLSSFSVPAEAAKVCKPRHTAGATHGAIRGSVEARAIVLWAGEIAANYTARYANWENAANRGVSCRRYTSALGVNLWQCRATATPCRLP
jgi:hypothetical protein